MIVLPQSWKRSPRRVRGSVPSSCARPSSRRSGILRKQRREKPTSDTRTRPSRPALTPESGIPRVGRDHSSTRREKRGGNGDPVRDPLGGSSTPGGPQAGLAPVLTAGLPVSFELYRRRNHHQGARDSTGSVSRVGRGSPATLCRQPGQHAPGPQVLPERSDRRGPGPPLFRRTAGRTFVEYLAELRVGRACDLLATTDLPVLEVSLRSGFETLSSFNRKFRALRGMTPREYRARHEDAGE